MIKLLIRYSPFPIFLCVVLFSLAALPQTVLAACGSQTITLGSGTDPSSATVAPGGAVSDADAMTFIHSHTGNTCLTGTVTALTISLANSGTPYSGIDSVRITSDDGSILYFAAVASTSIASNSVSFSGGTAIPVTESSVQFKIRITPLPHALMPAPNGASYTVQATTTSFTVGVTNPVTSTAGSDGMTNTITIDNASPAAATSLSATAAAGKTTLGWTSTNGESSTSTILRWNSPTVGSEVPVEGTRYSAGNTITTATVACVFANLSSATVESSIVDGSGGTAGCTTSALNNAYTYSYKVFQQDVNGNYDTGTNFSPTAAAATRIMRLFQGFRIKIISSRLKLQRAQ